MRIREILIICGLILSIFLVGVIGLLEALLDPTDNTDPDVRAENMSAEEVFASLMAEGLCNMDDEGRLTLHIDGGDMNRLLYSMRESLSVGPLILRSIYIEEEKGAYRLCVPVRIGGFETMLSGGLRLISEGDDILITLSDITVGSLGLNSSVVSLLELKSAIISALYQRGLSGRFEGDSLILPLSREDIGGLVATSLAEDKNGGLVNAMYSLLMLRTDAVEIDIGSPAHVDITVDLGRFGSSADSSFVGVNSYLEDLYSRGIVGREDLPLVAKYYINGYGRLADSERERIVSLLSSEGEVVSYSGVVDRSSLSLVSVLVSQLDQSGSSLFGDVGFKIADGDINDMLSDLEAVGSLWLFTDPDDTSCAYIGLSRIYSQIGDDRVSIFIDLDVNGYILTLSADFITSRSPLVSVTGSLCEMCVGEVALSEEESEQIFSFLSAYLKDDWISADAATRSLTLDFASAFEDDPLLSLIFLASKGITTTCRSSALHEGGFLLMELRLLS